MNPLLSLQLNENFLEKRFGENVKKKEDSQPFEALKFILRYIYFKLIINIENSKDKSNNQKE